MLMLPLVPLILTLLACLNVPLGSPETSKVDERLSGAWTVRHDGDEQMYILRPFDGRAYIVQSFNYKADRSEFSGMSTSKGWLTTIGSAAFITLEPINHKNELGVSDDKSKFWLVGRVNLSGDSLEYKPITNDSKLIKSQEPKTREALESLVKANVDNLDLYGETMRFQRADKDTIKAVLEAFHVE
jgi:hypothetical protein